MHTWALFSCSSLVTLTAYNLAQLPKVAESGPESEPDSGSELTDGSKFSLTALSQEFPQNQPAIAEPSLPDQPQMSKLDELSGYNPALYDPAKYPVEEVDLLGLFPESEAALEIADRTVTYRAETIQPLPSAIPASPVSPQPVRNALAEAMAASPTAIATPQPEAPTTSPTFAQSSPNAQALASTAPQSEPSVQTTAAIATPAESPSVQPATETDKPAYDDLFAVLPEPTDPQSVTDIPAPTAIAMADQQWSELPEFEATSPDSPFSMDVAIARHELIERYCQRARTEVKSDNKLAVCDGETNELAQRIPEAATAGTPIPGSVESPTRNSPAIGVL